MELNKTITNFFVAVAFLVLSAVTWFYVIPAQIPQNAIWGASTNVTSRTFPYFSVAIIALASLCELVKSAVAYRRLKKQGCEREKSGFEWKQELRAIAVFALCIVYALLFKYFGYIIATIIVPPVILLILGSRKWIHYVSVYSVGAILYVLFVFLLKIPLP